jgi:hypothetical protein
MEIKKRSSLVLEMLFLIIVIKYDPNIKTLCKISCNFLQI